jgi:pantoate--beta-alanine ligase
MSESKRHSMEEGHAEIVTTIAEVRQVTARARERGDRIALVPTMGALHQGHAALIAAAAARADCVIVSIFVNPTQFGPHEDFERYPRQLQTDQDLAKTAGAHWIFAPSVEEMYPHGKETTTVEVPRHETMWEGACRPGHFRGVATVVAKLFLIVQPDIAVFGQKDYQQILVIRQMTADLNFPVEIVMVPTVREPDGLALSSRNVYLSRLEREQALAISRALRQAEAQVGSGERDLALIRQTLQDTLKLECGLQLEYAIVVDADTLVPIDRLDPGGRAVALIAARVGTTRLIDNVLLEAKPG